MNTVAWLMQSSTGSRSIWAMCDNHAFHLAIDAKDEVFQFHHNTRRAAELYLIDQTEKAEKEGASLVGEPVTFDLSEAALCEVPPALGHRWLTAPTLHDELVTAVMAQPGVPRIHTIRPVKPTAGTIYYDTAANMVMTYDGSVWVKVVAEPSVTGGPWTNIGHTSASGVTTHTEWRTTADG